MLWILVELRIGVHPIGSLSWSAGLGPDQARGPQHQGSRIASLLRNLGWQHARFSRAGVEARFWLDWVEKPSPAGSHRSVHLLWSAGALACGEVISFLTAQDKMPATGSVPGAKREL
jgi:hypothetical protein